MTAQETAWQAAESAAAVLGPEAGMLASVDSAGLGEATLSVLQRAALQPAAVGTAALRFWTSMAMAGPVATARWLGMEAAPPVAVPDGDKRFADKTWSDNPAFFALRQGYLATSQLVSDLLDAGSGDATDDAKARLAAGVLVDAIAPTHPPAHQPGRAQARVRDRRDQRGQRGQAVRRRPGQQQRPAPAGRYPPVPGRGEHGRDAGQGRVQERPDGAHPVRAADQAGPGHPGAGQPALDQQVLRDGPGAGPQLPGVGGAARAHRARDLLPQP